jgi:hypothetical protein
MRCTRNNIILVFQEVTKKSGSIIIPGEEIDTNELKVYMVGPDVKEVKPGDVVQMPDVRIVAKRGVEYDMELPDGRKAIIVDEEDIRVVLAERDILEDTNSC